MRILGVDPGLRVTGYGVIERQDEDLRLIEAGVIKSKAADGIALRLHAIYSSVTELIEDTKPDVLVIEKLFAHYKHPSTAILMGHARGVVCLAAGSNDIPLVSIPSTRVKKAIVSHGHASKDQVGGAVKQILSLKRKPEPSDVTDALAIAISYAWTKRSGE